MFGNLWAAVSELQVRIPVREKWSGEAWIRSPGRGHYLVFLRGVRAWEQTPDRDSRAERTARVRKKIPESPVTGTPGETSVCSPKYAVP